MNDLPPFCLFVDCVPPKSTHQASVRIMKRKDGSQFVGKSQNSKGARVQRDLLALLSVNRPEQPYAGPVKLEVLWVYPWRKSEPKKNMRYGARLCDKRPDCDNLSKLLVDCLTKLHWWGDDSQVAHLQFTKAWGDRPGIGVRVCALHPGYLPEYCNQFIQQERYYYEKTETERQHTSCVAKTNTINTATDTLETGVASPEIRGEEAAKYFF